MKRLLTYTLAFSLLPGCKKNDDAPATNLPAVTTAAISAINSTAATGGGTIRSEGASPVTSRGVVWSTLANPTTSLPTKTSNGNGSGSFTSSIEGLTANTVYHVRAYATNSAGTAYGNEITFTTSPSRLYACGTEWNAALSLQQCKVWIDGNEGSFWGGNDESFGERMYVSVNGDIYVAGSTKVTQWRATYWKNGTPTYLTDGNYEASVAGIFVTGNDVYVCGSERNAAGTLVAKYWKNGVAVALTDGTTHAEAKDIYVADNVIYVAGYVNNSSGIQTARYWNNGNPVTIGTGGAANAIFVSGTDVHIAGTYSASSDIGWYWKNGSLNDLDNGYGANDIFVRGNDVYIAGFNDSYHAAYWKNGTIVNFADGASANAIYVAGNDVYIAGKTPSNNPCYWKNGQKTNLSSTNNWPNKATDIFYR